MTDPNTETFEEPEVVDESTVEEVDDADLPEEDKVDVPAPELTDDEKREAEKADSLRTAGDEGVGASGDLC